MPKLAEATDPMLKGLTTDGKPRPTILRTVPRPSSDSGAAHLHLHPPLQERASGDQHGNQGQSEVGVPTGEAADSKKTAKTIVGKTQHRHPNYNCRGTQSLGNLLSEDSDAAHHQQ